ncbi:MAG TPA: hypothetical protein VE991_01515, partial [Acidimicrobiales bacterium]|nr:hypothetical protein [Acidimicrobiales bacterium]
LVAPILMYLLNEFSTVRTADLRDAIWICLGLAAAGLVIGYALYAFGRPGLATPDIERWQEQGEPAWASPPLFDALRATADQAEPADMADRRRHPAA